MSRLDRYLTRTFERMGLAAPGGVLELLTSTNREVRAQFERIMATF